MSLCSKIHRKLLVEELEQRIAPAPLIEVARLLNDQVILYDTDATGPGDVDASDVALVQYGDGSLESVTIVGNPTGLGMLLQSNGTGAVYVRDARGGTLNDLGFIACFNSYNRLIQVNSGIEGSGELGDELVSEGLVPDADLDNDGETTDATALYASTFIQGMGVRGDISGDIVVDGTNAHGNCIDNLMVQNGDVSGDVATLQGGVSSFRIARGNFTGGMDINGDLGQFALKRMYDRRVGQDVGGSIDGASLQIQGTLIALRGYEIAGSNIAAAELVDLEFGGNWTNSELNISGDILGEIYVDGTVVGDIIASGNLKSGASIYVGGDVAAGNPTEGKIDIGGNVSGEIYVDGNIEGGIVVGEDVRPEAAIYVEGDVATELTISGSNGVMPEAEVYVGGDLDGQLTVTADVEGAIEIVGVVDNDITIQGTVAGTDGGLIIQSDVVNGTITIGGVGQTEIMGTLHGGYNDGTGAQPPNPFDTITIGSGELTIFWDGIHDVNYTIVHDGTKVTSFYADNSIDSLVASNLDFDSIVVDGRVKAQWARVGAERLDAADPELSAHLITVGDGSGGTNSTGIGIDVGSNVDYIRLRRFDHPDYTISVNGNLGSVEIEQGMLEGRIETKAGSGGNLTGTISTAWRQEIRGQISIDGDIASTAAIIPGGDTTLGNGENITGQIEAGGNMSGEIYAFYLGRDLTNENGDVFPLKGSIKVGGNIDGKIDIRRTMASYSSIEADGTIVNAAFDVSRNLTAGIRIRGLQRTYPLQGRIRTAIDLNSNVTFSIGDSWGRQVRTFTLANQGIVGNNAWLILDGRNLASSGWTNESPSLEIADPVSLSTLNNIIAGITYDGATGTFVSVYDVTLSDFASASAGTLTVLNVGNLGIQEEVEASDTLNVENDVWGTIDLGGNNMNGLIDIDGNLVYDVDNDCDGYIVSTAGITSYTGAVGIKFSGLGATDAMGGRIRTPLGTLNGTNSFAIGDSAGTRTFQTADLTATTTAEFDLMLDGRSVDGVTWSAESPTLIWTGVDDLTLADWEAVRTDAGTQYMGGAAANGLSFSGEFGDFDTWSEITTYNLGDLALRNTALIPAGETLTINNDLWGDLGIGHAATSSYLLLGTVDINGDLTGNINFLGRVDWTGLIDVAGDFAQGAELDYSPGNARDFLGDINVGGDYLGVFDINGVGTDLYRRSVDGYRGTMIDIKGNFGSPTVTGTLIDIEEGMINLQSVNDGRGLHIGSDGTGIMYGDLLVGSAARTTSSSYGYAVYFDTYIGTSGSAADARAYMAHTAKYECQRYMQSYVYIYDNDHDDAMRGQILAGTGDSVYGSNLSFQHYTTNVYGGMTEQAEIRLLKTTNNNRDLNGMIRGAFNYSLRFRGTVDGAICVGDGYTDAARPDEELYATFGRDFYIARTGDTGDLDFTGTIRTFGTGLTDGGGEFQGVMSYGSVDFFGDVSGKILGNYLPDFELNRDWGQFTGRIEAFEAFRGGGVRIAGTNAGTIRAGGRDLNLTQGTLASAGDALTITTVDGATLTLTTNTSTHDYQYLWAGTPGNIEHIEALRMEGGGEQARSVIGTGITLNSLYMEGRLQNSVGSPMIDFDEIYSNDGNPDNDFDTALHSLRLRYFRPEGGGATPSIEMEGDFGQFYVDAGHFEGNVTTTVGNVGTTADLTGLIVTRASTADFRAGTTIDIAGKVRENAGINDWSYNNKQVENTINVGGDFNGVLNICGGTTSTSVITIGNDLGARGRIYAGRTSTTLIGTFEGTINIGNDIVSGGLIDTARGPIAGTINVGRNVAGTAIRSGNSATADPEADFAATVDIGGNLSGSIQCYGQNGFTSAASITVDGNLSGSIRLRRTDPGDRKFAADLTVGGAMTGYVEVPGDITSDSTIAITGNVTSTRDAGAFDVGGNIAGAIDIDGGLRGGIDAVGNLTGTVDIANNLYSGSADNQKGRIVVNSIGAGGQIIVGGRISSDRTDGAIDVATDVYGTIDVQGVAGSTSIAAGAKIDVDGDLANTITLSNATASLQGLIDIAGSIIENLATPAGIVVAGNIGTTGEILVQSAVQSMRAAGAIDVEGNVDGKITVGTDSGGGQVYGDSRIDVAGDLQANGLIHAYGNVDTDGIIEIHGDASAAVAGIPGDKGTAGLPGVGIEVDGALNGTLKIGDGTGEKICDVVVADSNSSAGTIDGYELNTGATFYGDGIGFGTLTFYRRSDDTTGSGATPWDVLFGADPPVGGEAVVSLSSIAPPLTPHGVRRSSLGIGAVPKPAANSNHVSLMALAGGIVTTDNLANANAILVDDAVRSTWTDDGIGLVGGLFGTIRSIREFGTEGGSTISLETNFVATATDDGAADQPDGEGLPSETSNGALVESLLSSNAIVHPAKGSLADAEGLSMLLFGNVTIRA